MVSLIIFERSTNIPPTTYDQSIENDEEGWGEGIERGREKSSRELRIICVEFSTNIKVEKSY